MAETPSKATPAKATAPAPTERPEAAGNLATDGDVIGSTAVPGVDVDAHDKALKDAGSSDPEDHQIPQGNFYAPHLEGAGTILPGGGYGPPLPDPQVQRKNADEDYQVK
jgi:hypothetical protein